MKTRLYRHYKNKMYKYLGPVRHSETLEEMALYETLYENDLGQTWVRPKELFFGKLEVNNQLVDRFEEIELKVQEFETITPEQFQILQLLCSECSVNIDHSKIDEVILLQVVTDLQKPVGFKLGYAENSNTFVSHVTAVRPEYRHLGIATGLNERQQKWCQRNKFGKIKSYVFNKNTDLFRLNLKMGFQVIAVDSENRIVLEKNI
ncbi:MAG: GNAT family N-acetyltransferase [Bdellovibrio sp.]|nr:GNAT family N-acetyltransferase [Bdellovibrio sp.]